MIGIGFIVQGLGKGFGDRSIAGSGTVRGYYY